MSQVLLNERINVLAVNTRSNKEDNTATMQLTIEIPGLDALDASGARFATAQHHRGAAQPYALRRGGNRPRALVGCPWPFVSGKGRMPGPFTEDPRYLAYRPRRPAPPHGAPARSRIRLPPGISQSYATIVPHTLEEAYEVADAIEQGDFPQLREELGDRCSRWFITASCLAKRIASL